MAERLVDVTVIGGGPCGLFAAFYAGLRGLSCRIIDSLPELGGQLVALYPEKYVYDMPGYAKVLAKDLAHEMAEQGTKFNPELVLGDTAQILSREGDSYSIATSSGKELPTRTVVISAGAGAFTPTRIGLEDEADWEGRGLLYGVRDKESLRGKRVVIVGGGDSAFDWCLNLLGVASSITLVHRRDQFRAHEESVREVLESPVVMRLWCAVKEIRGDDALAEIRIENSQTGESECLECDALIVNVGYKSSLGPIKNWGIEIDKNQILVNQRFETNLPGVFAVGDVATFEGKLKLIATGCGEAATAICYAKLAVDPEARLFPGHSSDMDLSPEARAASH